MKKKIILGIGSMLMATTAAVSVVSCNGNKETPVVTPTGGDDNGGSPTADAKKTPLENAKSLVGALKSDLGDKPKEVLAQSIVKFVNGGVSKISGAELKNILETFGVTGDLPNILGGVLESGALDIVLNKGFKAIYASDQDREKKVGDIVAKILPKTTTASNKIQQMFTKELITKLLVGFTNITDFRNNLFDILTPLVSNTILTSIKRTVNKDSTIFVPLFEKGLLGITPDEFIDSLKVIAPIVNAALTLSSANHSNGIQQFLLSFSQYRKNSQSGIGHSIDMISNALINLLQDGLKSLSASGTSYNELVNLIEIIIGKKDSSTITNSATLNASLTADISKTKIGTVVGEIVPNIDKILKFLNNGLSGSNWEQTFNDFYDSLSKILTSLNVQLPLVGANISGLKPVIKPFLEKMRTN